MSPGHSWLLSICILMLLSKMEAATASTKNATAIEIEKLEELRNTRNCKALCEHCDGCMGFYCGEECICECNNDKSDTECITTMQNNARQLEIPFEILIQGPSTNSFLRNARHFADPFQGSKNVIVPGRKRRSTLIIYKPGSMGASNMLESQSDCKSSAASSILKQKESTQGRHKRSTAAQMDWFTDLAHNLVRPAPFRRATPKPVEEEPVEDKVDRRGAKRKTELDRSWFTDNTQSLVRPAPIFGRQGGRKLQRQSQRKSNSRAKKDQEEEENEYMNEEEDDEDDNILDENNSMLGSAIRKIPKAIKDTLQNIQDNTAFADSDFTNVMKSKSTDFSEALPRPALGNFQTNESPLRDYFGRTLEHMRAYNSRNEVVGPISSPTMPTPKQNYKYVIPWMRGNRRRFAQRKGKTNPNQEE